MDSVQLAAVLAAAVVLASMLSVELGISVALLELGLGVLAGNLFGLDPNADWLVFIASFASIVLTFLAGAEVDPDDFGSGSARRWRSGWCRSSVPSSSRHWSLWVRWGGR
jgi:Kef-type K+ transport system membrane component KefB